MIRNCCVFANSRWTILALLLLADSGYLGIFQWLSYTLWELHRGFPVAFWAFTSGLPTPFQQCLAAFLYRYPFSSAQRPSYTLSAVPSGLPTPFQQCPAAFLHPLRAFPSSCRLKHAISIPFSLKGLFSAKIYFKSNEHLKILKTTSGSSPRTDLTYNITSSPSQSHVTVPLNVLVYSVLKIVYTRAWINITGTFLLMAMYGTVDCWYSMPARNKSSTVYIMWT
jgi:hypothetical protein